MCLSLRSDELFRDWPASRDIYDGLLYERSQIEPAVEPVGERSQVMACVLAVLQRMKSTGQRGLQVAEHCADPLELRQIAGPGMLSSEYRFIFYIKISCRFEWNDVGLYPDATEFFILIQCCGNSVSAGFFICDQGSG